MTNICRSLTLAALALAAFGNCAPSTPTLTRRQAPSKCQVMSYESTVGVYNFGGPHGNSGGWGMNVQQIQGDGTPNFLWQSENNLGDTQTISAADTKLPYDIAWTKTDTGCAMDYNGFQGSGTTDDNSYNSGFYSNFGHSCKIEFDCAIPVATGQCGFHVKQHQKADPAVDSYTYDVSLKDANGIEVGSVIGQSIPTANTFDLTSSLASPLTITSGGVDDDPVGFAYNGVVFDSNSEQCSVGGYDAGARDMDCGFAC